MSRYWLSQILALTWVSPMTAEITTSANRHDWLFLQWWNGRSTHYNERGFKYWGDPWALPGDQEKQLYPRDLKVIIDCRSTRLVVKLDDVSRITEAAKNAIPKYMRLREAILITAPYETVVATLFEQNARFKNYNFRLFNSENAALRWLNAV